MLRYRVTKRSCKRGKNVDDMGMIAASVLATVARLYIEMCDDYVHQKNNEPDSAIYTSITPDDVKEGLWNEAMEQALGGLWDITDRLNEGRRPVV